MARNEEIKHGKLIDADALIDQLGVADSDIEFKYMLEDAPAVDAVPAELLNALKSLVNGEWVDCKLVEDALGIDFVTGCKMFNLSRTAEWNPAPLNGQKITTKFRLKNAVHGRWEPRSDAPGFVRCSNCHDCNVYDDWIDGKKWKYCPNCGAKMDLEV